MTDFPRIEIEPQECLNCGYYREVDKDYMVAFVFAVAVWITLSVVGSIIKQGEAIKACGKIYPIDYVIYTNLFCAIKE
mgnify:CR=1 FL=1